jgi:hypothetical protein
MAIRNICIVIFFIFLFPSISFSEIKNVPCGYEWINIHKNNPDLIGVYVQQYPDNLSDRAAYEGKHPCMVIFVFKGNKAHQVEYSPTGQVENGFWWDIPAGHSLLNNISKDLKPDIYCGFWVKSKK